MPFEANTCNLYQSWNCGQNKEKDYDRKLDSQRLAEVCRGETVGNSDRYPPVAASISTIGVETRCFNTHYELPSHPLPRLHESFWSLTRVQAFKVRTFELRGITYGR